VSRKKTNDILTVYLRKRKVHIQLTLLNDLGGLEVPAIRIGGQACLNVYHLEMKYG